MDPRSLRNLRPRKRRSRCSHSESVETLQQKQDPLSVPGPTDKGFEYDGADSDQESSTEPYEEPWATSSRTSWQYALKLWMKFTAARGAPVEESLEKGRPFPTIHVLKKFIYYIAQRPTKSRRAPTTHSIKCVLSHFSSAFHKATGAMIGDEARVALADYINQQLPKQLGISKARREKYTFIPKDLDNLLRVMWTTDRCTFVHERQRVQMTFYLLVHAFCGARAATFIEGVFERHTNHCLTYQAGCSAETCFLDIGLHLYWNDNGDRELIVEPTLRHTKKNKDTSNNWFRVTMSSEDRLLRNPLAFFLALAFADDAIKGVSSVEQFWEIRPRQGQKSFQLEWNKEKLDTPVFRMVNATGPTPDAWHTLSMFYYLRNVVKNAGYKEGSVTIHTLRRGVANVVDKRATPAERDQLLGWSSSEIYGRHYQSRVSSVDSQAAFLGQAPKSKPISLLRSTVRVMNPGIPKQMSAQAALDLSTTAEMKATSEKLATLSEHEMQEKKRIYKERSRLRTEALKKFQAVWLEEDYINTVSMSTDLKDVSPVENRMAQSQRDFEILRPFIQERSRIADLADAILPQHGTAQQSAIQDLVALCTQQDHRVLYRPDQSPVAGRCPVGECYMTISRYPLEALTSTHVDAVRLYYFRAGLNIATLVLLGSVTLKIGTTIAQITLHS
ncbi:MAG: hypothetical protein Q9228_005515 [Teloschistes exilis]